MPSLAISSLLCHRDMASALICLESVKKYFVEPVKFLIHDDGSLSDEDVAILDQRLSPVQVIRRRDADQRMADELRRFPASAAYRRGCVMGLKLCDSVYYNSAPIYAYCDSDVLFFRPVQGFFDLPDPRFNAVFMQDPYNTYSCRSWQLLLSPNLRLPQQFNAGLGCLRRENYDPEFIEWFLADPRHRGSRHPGVPEQTAWAALAMRAGCQIYDPCQVLMVRPGLQLTDQAVALHVVGMYRQSLGQYVGHCVEIRDGRPPAQVRRSPARRCTSLHLLGGEFRKTGGRLFQKLKRRLSAQTT